MIKLKAYFNDKYETYLPLTSQSDKEIGDNMYGIEYISIETDLDIPHDDIQYAGDFINECYDLLVSHEIAYFMKDWGKKEFTVYLDMIEGIESDIEILKWTHAEYTEFVGKFIK